ncbi:hypothetical protein CK503_00805 [Aliifodinibius salipaludis]|uniref:Lipid/polyisoprenoid-binding YceI-like domain-containing protein n=1 Tax=Fodinibius salipaludis TaxID=2032627 RepID=A0A2A2GDC5_9BACT|nr:hypothetical protein [Aliifodinibius salipaludis]PAU95636.1 hypothetical protein CK503_00805 [Aliifodinibius salipaludis]
MVKRKVFYVFIIFAVAVSFISCSEEKEQKVDKQYLDAQDYSTFKENTDQELKESSNSENLADNLVEVSDCASVSTLEMPFSLNWEVLKNLSLKADPCNVEEEHQTLTLVAEQTLEAQTVRWFLLDYQSVYTNAEVIVATFSDNELRSFSTVGMYEKIPAHNIQTTITVNGEGNSMLIRSETIRDIKYPVEQKNTITVEYKINAKGSINEL